MEQGPSLEADSHSHSFFRRSTKPF